MELVTPGIGLVFWTVLTFLIVLGVLSQFAWKPITQALKDRELSISQALAAAEDAKKNLLLLQSSNEQLLQEASVAREKMMRDAKITVDKMIADATEKANSEKNRIVAEAQDAIRTEKNLALAEVRKQVADLSLEIAEKVIRRQLSDKSAQMELVKGYLNDVKVN